MPSSTHKPQQGFTLVELAVVMIIIGLLLGGVLKGQELVENARIHAVVVQFKSFQAADAGFRDIYRAMAGDMRNATERLPDCATMSGCGDGDGNSRLDAIVGFRADLGESRLFFNHLLRADLIGGFEGVNAQIFGQNLPTSPMGGGWGASDTRAGIWAGLPAFPAGRYLNLTSEMTDAREGVLSPRQAARLDRKLDDGMPSTGTVHSLAPCIVDSAYDEANNTATCAIFIRF